MVQSTRLENNAELARWLDANTRFENARILELSDQDQKQKGRLRIWLSLELNTTQYAGESKRLRDYTLTAEGVTSPALGEWLDFVPGTYSPPLELLNVPEGLGFRLEVPGELVLRCEALTIESHDERTEFVTPKLSRYEISMEVFEPNAPEPNDWVRRFAEQGIEVCWRAHGDSAEVRLERESDCTGWLLQLRQRLELTEGGLLCTACRKTDAGWLVEWSMLDDNDDETLWTTMQRVLGQFAEGRIRCGNCVLSTEEWQTYVVTRRWPFAGG